MTITVWRVVKTAYAHDPASGAGADKYGGRWNSKGVPVIYAAESLALAMFEAGLDPDDIELMKNFSKVSFEVDKTLIASLSKDQLPDDWDSVPAAAGTKSIGDSWMKTRDSVVLAVPSMLASDERCYILNPEHPDFNRILVGTALPV